MYIIQVNVYNGSDMLLYIQYMSTELGMATYMNFDAAVGCQDVLVDFSTSRWVDIVIVEYLLCYGHYQYKDQWLQWNIGHISWMYVT